mmetsp:Transcript_64025/g.187327  ORF Transcript_64025/g.187327 Transcript_64025/m.187327 type:complete len:265 (+) Transcript_64025:241-1035(+)
MMSVRCADLAHLGPRLAFELLGLAPVEENLPTSGSLVPVLLELPLLGLLLSPPFPCLFDHQLVTLHVCLHNSTGIRGRLCSFSRHLLALLKNLSVKVVPLHLERILSAFCALLVILLSLLPDPLFGLSYDVLIFVLVVGVFGVIVRLHEDLEGLRCFLQLAFVRVNQYRESSVLLRDLRIGSLRTNLQHLVGGAIPLPRVVSGSSQPLNDLFRRACVLLDLFHFGRLHVAHLIHKRGEEGIHSIVLHGALGCSAPYMRRVWAVG